MQTESIGGTTTSFTWNIEGQIPAMIAVGSTYYVYGANGLPLEQINGSFIIYYYQDREGSTVALTNSSGADIATYTYDPYGNLIKPCPTPGQNDAGGSSYSCATQTDTGTTPSSNDINNPFLYDGQYLDPASGLYYLRARFYDPATGQFMSVDPLVGVTGQAYSYASGDPLNRVDLFGLCSNGQEGGRFTCAGGLWVYDPVLKMVPPLASYQLHSTAWALNQIASVLNTVWWNLYQPNPNEAPSAWTQSNVASNYSSFVNLFVENFTVWLTEYTSPQYSQAIFTFPDESVGWFIVDNFYAALNQVSAENLLNYILMRSITTIISGIADAGYIAQGNCVLA